MGGQVAILALALPTPVTRERTLDFDELVRTHEDDVYGAALRILGDPDEARDAASAAFLKAYRAFDRYDPSRPLRHWLLRIATNEALTIARARTRDRARRAPEEAAVELADAAPTPEHDSLRRERHDAVRAAVAALPELYRVPIVLRYFNDLSLDEIAAVTRRPSATVGVQLLRGRALLRSALGADR